jgi:hypothetical protein
VRRSAAALVATAVLAAAGCGGGDGERDARDAYLERADAICRRGNERLAPYAARIAKLNAKRDPRQLVAEAPGILRRAVRESRRSVAALERIEPPRDDAGRIARWLKGLRRQNDLAAQTADAIEKRDARRLDRLATQTRRANITNNTFARRYGLKDCSRHPV